MMYVHALMGAESTPGPPVIRTIGVMDLKDALARGMSDFSAMPTHALFLCLIYPIVGLILARVSFGYDVLSLLNGIKKYMDSRAHPGSNVWLSSTT